MQASEQIYKQKSSRGFTALGVLVENATGGPPNAANLQSWVVAYHVTFPVLGDPMKVVFPAYVHETVLPASFLIGRNGVVRFTVRGTSEEASAEAQLDAEIEAALAAPAGGG